MLTYCPDFRFTVGGAQLEYSKCWKKSEFLKIMASHQAKMAPQKTCSYHITMTSILQV